MSRWITGAVNISLTQINQVIACSGSQALLTCLVMNLVLRLFKTEWWESVRLNPTNHLYFISHWICSLDLILCLTGVLVLVYLYQCRSRRSHRVLMAHAENGIDLKSHLLLCLAMNHTLLCGPWKICDDQIGIFKSVSLLYMYFKWTFKYLNAMVWNRGQLGWFYLQWHGGWFPVIQQFKTL